MKPSNLVVIMSDEHNPAFMGHRGHPLALTPNLDRLASRGSQFSAAYCNSPICVPSRASFATGRYVHDCGFWDNASPYDGSVPSWGHRLQDQGHAVVSIGKLHYRRTEDDNGFMEEIEPLHVVDGVGDLLGLVREDMPVRAGVARMAEEVGCGETRYTSYDRTIASAAEEWISQAPQNTQRPWVLFVSFVCPHFPLVAPAEFYNRYADKEIPIPSLYAPEDRPDHPFYVAMRGCFDFDSHFNAKTRELAIRGYLGLVSFMDDNVGRIVQAIDTAGLADTTRVMYVSDHGEALGKRGFWGKSTMYDESASVPLIIAGPGVAEGANITTPVSLVDVYPTILESVGAKGHPDDEELPGDSLYQIQQTEEKDRIVFSEYHAAGAMTGCYMLRRGRFKLIYYADLEPELYDLGSDPDETINLASDPTRASLLSEMIAALKNIVDPKEVNAQAMADQRALIEVHGGRDVILARGDFGYSPPPGQAAKFSS